MDGPQVEPLDASDIEMARRLLEIQRAAYRVEADLIGFDGIPPLHETLDDLVTQPLNWIGVRVGGQVVAALAYRVTDGICDIDRLVVDPEHFGRGYASTLLASLFDHPCITVSTATANTPARRLYEKHGFQRVDEVEIAPGVTATHYERLAMPSLP